MNMKDIPPLLSTLCLSLACAHFRVKTSCQNRQRMVMSLTKRDLIRGLFSLLFLYPASFDKQLSVNSQKLYLDAVLKLSLQLKTGVI